MFCPNCGESLPNTARFCFACGKPIEPPIPPQNQPPEPPVTQPESFSAEPGDTRVLPSFSRYVTPPPSNSSEPYAPPAYRSSEPPMPPEEEPPKKKNWLLIALIAVLGVMVVGVVIFLIYLMNYNGNKPAVSSSAAPTTATADTTASTEGPTTAAPVTLDLYYSCSDPGQLDVILAKMQASAKTTPGEVSSTAEIVNQTIHVNITVSGDTNTNNVGSAIQMDAGSAATAYLTLLSGPFNGITSSNYKTYLKVAFDKLNNPFGLDLAPDMTYVSEDGTIDYYQVTDPGVTTKALAMTYLRNYFSDFYLGQIWDDTYIEERNGALFVGLVPMGANQFDTSTLTLVQGGTDTVMVSAMVTDESGTPTPVTVTFTLVNNRYVINDVG